MEEKSWIEFYQQNKLVKHQFGVFVKEICAKRDESHGWKHMKKVFKTACVIFVKEGYHKHQDSDKIFTYVMYISLLHDVADHKYDKDGILKKKLNRFLMNHLNKQDLDEYEKDLDVIQKGIDFISYSTEKKLMLNNLDHRKIWLNKLGNLGLIARDIVSDADKLEALGKIGFERCRQVTIERLGLKTEQEVFKHENEIMRNVEQHAQEKLFELKNHFIVTKTGKILAEPLHQELYFLVYDENCRVLCEKCVDGKESFINMNEQKEYLVCSWCYGKGHILKPYYWENYIYPLVNTNGTFDINQKISLEKALSSQKIMFASIRLFIKRSFHQEEYLCQNIDGKIDVISCVIHCNDVHPDYLLDSRFQIVSKELERLGIFVHADPVWNQINQCRMERNGETQEYCYYYVLEPKLEVDTTQFPEYFYKDVKYLKSVNGNTKKCAFSISNKSENFFKIFK